MSGASTAPYLAAGAAAAPSFGLDVGELALLNHSENVVLTLTTTVGERFAMRIHRPGYNTLAEMESEVQFADSLRRHGVPVPEALASEAGGHYEAVDVRGVEHLVGVISWVDGEPLGGPLQAGEGDVAGHYRRIGELAAQIRRHNAAWTAPSGFTRRRWDADGLVGDSPIWDRFWEVDRLTDAQRRCFTVARDHLSTKLGALPTDDDHFGLIHADLHLGNVMVSGDELTIIDFDDAGYGWFMHELAVALHPMLGEAAFDDALTAIVDGYRSVHALPDDEVALIDDFLAMRSLMIVGWLSARPEVPHYEHWDDIVSDIEAHVEAYLSTQ